MQLSCKECNLVPLPQTTMEKTMKSNLAPEDNDAAMTDASSPAHPTLEQKRTLRRVVSASFVGNFVEWFDYGVYGYFATTISLVFFPASEGNLALLSTFAVFAVSFVVRPIGGFIWRNIGSTIGRLSAPTLSIAIMSVASFAIGLLPGFAMAGLSAPALLLVVRLVAGFSAAGAYAGASVFLVEYAPAGRRGLY